ncbi:MAG TPA: gamma-glutamyltransferase family protein [Rhizomicrobium sp.]|nr:gamma-glutamyltransferase family protein [Rhizomicrobium sp.]
MRKFALLTSALAAVTVLAGLLWWLSPPSAATTTVAARHVTVTANPYASHAAREILRKGGSAVDAAIAAQLVLTLVEPQSSGIGGGLFLLVSDARGGMRVYDGRETAPAAVRPNLFLGQNREPRQLDEVATGGLAVGIPGAVAALALAHKQYGALPWGELFGPAIQHAEAGFIVSPLLARAIASLDRKRAAASMQIYFHLDGSPVGAGERMRDPQLATTLRKIAREGPPGFYEGEVAQAIVASVRSAERNPGEMTLDDLKNYRAVERGPVCRPFKKYRVCTTPSPSGGITVLQILGILADKPSEALRPGTLSQIHLLSQAERLAYSDRAKWLADPDYANVPANGLLDESYLRSRAKLIDADRDMGHVEAGIPPERETSLIDFAPHRTKTLHGTSHLAIVDKNGLVVSMTSSVQAAFGAQIRAAGFVLNNELTDFSLEPTIDQQPVANAPAAGKRPLSAMSPAIVFDPQGRFFAAIGSPGGREIIAYNAQALVNLIAAKATISSVVSVPHFANENDSTVLEKGTSLITQIPALLLMGHAPRLRELESGLNGIQRSGSAYEAASDVRGEGAAAGD